MSNGERNSVGRLLVAPPNWFVPEKRRSNVEVTWKEIWGGDRRSPPLFGLFQQNIVASLWEQGYKLWELSDFGSLSSRRSEPKNVGVF